MLSFLYRTAIFSFLANNGNDADAEKFVAEIPSTETKTAIRIKGQVRWLAASSSSGRNWRKIKKNEALREHTAACASISRESWETTTVVRAASVVAFGILVARSWKLAALVDICVSNINVPHWLTATNLCKINSTSRQWCCHWGLLWSSHADFLSANINFIYKTYLQDSTVIFFDLKCKSHRVEK